MLFNSTTPTTHPNYTEAGNPALASFSSSAEQRKRGSAPPIARGGNKPDGAGQERE